MDKSGNKTLVALTGAALALPGMSGKAATPVDPQFDYGYFHYEEGGPRMAVDTSQTRLSVPLSDHLDVSFNGVRDAISGASPVYNQPDCQSLQPAPAAPSDTVSGPSIPSSGDEGLRMSAPTAARRRASVAGALSRLGASALARPFQSLAADAGSASSNCTPSTGVRQVLFSKGFQDVRDEGDVHVNYYLGDTTIGVGGGISRENDYGSDFAGIDIRQELNQKRTTLAAGYSIASDEVRPSNRPDFSASKFTHQFLLGATQVLDRNSLLQLNLAYSYGVGYLTDPYKFVYVVNGTPEGNVIAERRPNHRHQWNFVSRYAHFFPQLGSALHLDYRYSIDTWGVDAHTFEASWIQGIGAGWQLTPTLRYYTQDQADFYRDYFVDLPGNQNYSSDYRLASFGALSGGLRLGKRFFDQLRLDAGIEYYERQAAFKLGGNGGKDFADYNFVIYSITMNLRF